MKMKRHSLILMIVCVFSLNSFSQTAKWITAFQNQDATNTWICYRKTVTLESLPKELNVRIAADTKYWMWINGELVVFEGGVKRGPTPRDTYFDKMDIRPYLKKGNNLIAVLVWYFGKGGFSHVSSGKAALFFDATDQNGQFSFSSDKSWKASVCPAYQTAGEPFPNFRLPESSIRFDARKEWIGWNINPDFKNNSLEREAVELGNEGDAPWNKLYDRIIPQWKNSGLLEYENTIVKKGEKADTIICKLPYNAQITPFIKIKSNAGKVITIYTDNLYGGSDVNVKAEYVTRNGLQQYESFGWMNGHYVYYVIPNGTEIVELRYRETSYNTEFAGSFECNDQFLNKLWEKARRTLLVTMRDTYMDCPDRERAQWWGDAVNESGEAFYALCPESHKLAKKGMYELIRWQKPNGALYSPVPASNWDKELPSQMLATVGYYGFWNYYLHTADIETIKDLYKGVKRYVQLTEFEADGTAKLRKGDWNWGDWGTNIDNIAVYNAWYYLAVKGLMNMAEVIGNKSERELYTEKMVSFKDAFNKRFWQQDYYMTPNFEGKPDDRVQALAVVAGLADHSKYKKLISVFKTSEFASPYMEKYVLEALFQMNQGEFALERMKKRFGKMVNDSLRTTLYEGWGIGAKGFGGGTINHAWSGGGLTILSQYLCGIEPIKPGYEEFKIAPQPAGIKHASAKVHSVGGLIKTDFNDTVKKFVLNISIPVGLKAKIKLPYSSKRITCNGVLKKDVEELVLEAGEYKLEQIK